MKIKRFLAIFIILALIFTVYPTMAKPNNPNKGPGNNSGNGNPNPPGQNKGGDITNNYYNYTANNNDQTYNSFLYEYYVNQSYDFSNIETTMYDQRQYISVNNTPVLEAIKGLSADNHHEMVNNEASATLGIKYGEISPNTIIIPKFENIDPNMVFEVNPKLYLNPIKKVVQLIVGEFANVQIAIVADRNSILNVKCNNPNVEIVTKKVIAIKNTPSIVNVQLYFKYKTTQWEYAFITFEDALVNKELESKSMIIFENKEALDWKTRFTIDTDYTTAGLSVSQNKTSWGWGLFTGIKTDKRCSLYAVLEIDL